MTLKVDDRVRLNNGNEGVVTRINVLNVQKSARILLDNGIKTAVFGKKYDDIKKI